MKGPNLQIMGVEEVKIQTKGTDNLFNRIIAEKFPNLERESPSTGSLQNTKPSRPKRNTPRHIIIKTLSTQNKEGILKLAKEKRQVKMINNLKEETQKLVFDLKEDVNKQ
jgi:hypothetical protein